ncbi:transglutaminase-like domain-containing protein [uncultured Algibacter sp.]|uniref:transglutaminase-like domain-containing protein n=1 Tax=uncultured Algibacter sp. TaxID=298659 RepID=UPI003217A70D
MYILRFTLLILSFNLAAQESEEFNLYKKLYPNSNSVRINQETKVTINIDSDKIYITQEFIEEDLYLDESAKNNAKKSLHFSSFFELKGVEASSFNYENGKYRELKVKEFKEKDELNKSFYDDSKSLNFLYQNLKKGSKSRLKYSENVKNPRFLSPFYFADFSPIASNKVTIIADKNINLTFKEFQTENFDIKFHKEEKRNTNIYIWELKNTAKYKYEPNAPTYKKILPHIVPIITSYKTKGTEVKLASDISDLYKWYYSLVKDINKEPIDEELVALVNKLTTNKSSNLEKVKAIYYWAQKNIKYIAFEYALGGFIPRQANDVFKKKYGDCKDNSSILYKMLEIANLKGNLTWIGTRTIPYNYNDVPTPLVDNHMILSFTEQDSTYFLDATGRYIPIEYPTPFIQGKEALISKGKSGFIIKKIPIIPAHKNAIIDTTNISLIDNDLTGASKIEISGYRKVDCYNSLEYATTKQKSMTFYNNLLRKGNNRFLIDDYTEINKYNYDENFKVNYAFSINGYAQTLGNEIYINLNLNKALSLYKTEEDRKNEIEYDYKNEMSYFTKLSIPQGYTIDYIPDNVSISNDFFTSHINYSSSPSNITYSHHISFNFLMLNPEQQKEMNAMIKTIEKAYKEVVILKKI